MTDEFGWSRRNAFIQPQVDAVMLEGLSRFPNVRCLFSRELEAFSQQNGEVTLNLKAPDGQRETVKAQVAGGLRRRRQQRQTFSERAV